MKKATIKDEATKIAETIVRDLFSNGAGEEAKRLMLLLPYSTDRGVCGRDRDGGGWSREAAAHRIATILRRHLRGRLKDK